MARYWEDLCVGERFHTGGLALSEADILEFAREFDPQPYHLDRAAAADSIFGGLCASGWQVAALMMRLLHDAFSEAGLELLGELAAPSLRWKAPVFAGDSLTAAIEITDLSPEAPLPQGGSVELDIVVSNQDAAAVVQLTSRVMLRRHSKEDALHG